MSPAVFYGPSEQPPCPQEPQFVDWLGGVASHHSLRSLVVLEQVHGTDGVVIGAQEAITPGVQFGTQQGDFLLTDQQGVGLGVLTADCVPVVLRVPGTSIIGVVHAGWRGACAGVLVNAVQRLCQQFQVQAAQIHATFGASARACCYRIGTDVLDLIADPVRVQCVRTDSTGGAFLDVSTLLAWQLMQQGVPMLYIDQTANQCTIHNESFFSFRRDKTVYRQLTLAWSCAGVRGAVLTSWP